MSKLFKLGKNKRTFFAETPSENGVDDVSGCPKFLLRASDLSSRKVNFAVEAVSLILRCLARFKAKFSLLLDFPSVGKGNRQGYIYNRSIAP